MSSAVTVTSTWPETPVSSCRMSTLRSSGSSRGTSSRKSEMISVRVPATQPATARIVAAAITLPGLAIDTASERGPIFASRSRSHVRPREIAAGGFGSRSRRLAARWLPSPPAPVSERIANPAVSASTNAMRMPATSSTPNERTIGIGESSSTEKPAAVARHAVATTGPPRAAASAAARAGDDPPSRASTKRACSWIA